MNPGGICKVFGRDGRAYWQKHWFTLRARFLSLSFPRLNSSFIRARPPWREEAAGSGPKRGKEEERRKKDSMESMNRSPFSFFHRRKERAFPPFSNLPNTARRPWEPMLKDTLLSLSLSTSLFYFSLSFSLPFSRHFVGKSTLDSRIDAPLQRSSSYPIRFFLSYIHLALTFLRSYWKIKILSFFLSAFRRENIARRGVTSMDGWNEQIFFEN